MKYLPMLPLLALAQTTASGTSINKDANSDTVSLEGYTLVELMRLKQELSEENFQAFLLEQQQLQHPNLEHQRNLQRYDFSYCFYEGDGCTTCSYDAAGNAEIYCPDFCGPGHSYAANVRTESYLIGDTLYPYANTACSVWGCDPIATDICLLFSFNPQEENTWTCSDVCGSDAAVATPTDIDTTATTNNAATATNTHDNNNNSNAPYSASCEAQYNAMVACSQKWSEEAVQGCLECYASLLENVNTCSDAENMCKDLPEQCECGDCHESILTWNQCEGQEECPGLSCSAIAPTAGNNNPTTTATEVTNTGTATNAADNFNDNDNGSNNGKDNDEDKNAALVAGAVEHILGFGLIVAYWLL